MERCRHTHESFSIIVVAPTAIDSSKANGISAADYIWDSGVAAGAPFVHLGCNLNLKQQAVAAASTLPTRTTLQLHRPR